MLIDSIYRKDKSYHPQVFLEEWGYVVKVKKMSEFVTGNTEISSDDLIKKILMKKILIKKIKYGNFFKRKHKEFFNLAARKFHSPKYKKNIFREKYKKFFKLRTSSKNIKNIFFQKMNKTF